MNEQKPLSFKDLIKYNFLYFSLTSPSFINPLIKTLKPKINYLNKVYSKLTHIQKRIVKLSSSQITNPIIYRGDKFFQIYLEAMLAKTGIDNISIEKIPPLKNNKEDISKVNVLRISEYQKRGYLIIPDWVNSSLNINDIESNNLNRSAKRSIKSIEENKLSYFIIQADKIIETFYYDFYKPTIESIHKESGLVKEFNQIKIFSKKSQIINIRHNNMTMALVLIIPTKDGTLYIYAAGLQQDMSEKLKNIANDAIFYFSIKTAQDENFKKIDFGLNRSFLNDGVLNYKKKWGCQFSISPNQVYSIAINTKSKAMKQFLKSNPIFFHEKDHISSIFYFKDEKPDVKDIESIHKSWKNSGTKNIYIISPEGFNLPNNQKENFPKNLILSHKDLDEFIVD